MSDALEIRVATAPEATNLDQLLWEVLWKPFGFPRNIREQFKLEGECIELVSFRDSQLVGGLVANWISSNVVELRHIAVRHEAQRDGVGKALVDCLLGIIVKKGCIHMVTWARSTSVGFFRRLGFSELSGETLEHPAFSQHGIKFHKMRYDVTVLGNHT